MKFNIEAGKTYTFKLLSGEEFVAKVEAVVNDDLVELAEPVSIATMGQGMGMIPTLFTQDPKEKTVLNTNSVALVATTLDLYADKYRERTTGIKVPEKKIITG
jgi:predicted DNA-binding protein with PD1-like motif